mmetsp:Transcript_52005/g.103328  ORF Transcript_52005/g.103328 Transcript_52005/m.103328 type:complete len:91 (-) Transcript_52005:751-1023(-)
MDTNHPWCFQLQTPQRAAHPSCIQEDKRGKRKCAAAGPETLDKPGSAVLKDRSIETESDDPITPQFACTAFLKDRSVETESDDLITPQFA